MVCFLGGAGGHERHWSGGRDFYAFGENSVVACFCFLVSCRVGTKVCLIVAESFLGQSLGIRQVDGAGILGKVERPARAGLFRFALSENLAQAESFGFLADQNSNGD